MKVSSIPLSVLIFLPFMLAILDVFVVTMLATSGGNYAYFLEGPFWFSYFVGSATVDIFFFSFIRLISVVGITIKMIQFPSWKLMRTINNYLPIYLTVILSICAAKGLSRLVVGPGHQFLNTEFIWWSLSMSGVFGILEYYSLSKLSTSMYHQLRSEASRYDKTSSSSKKKTKTKTRKRHKNGIYEPLVNEDGLNGDVEVGDHLKEEEEEEESKTTKKNRILEHRYIWCMDDVPLSDDDSSDEEDLNDEDEKKKDDDDDISGRDFKATLSDFYNLVRPDSSLISLAFVFLTIAAICQVLIPHFTGQVIDSIVDDVNSKKTSEEDARVEFHVALQYLVLSAIGCAIFTGLRGGTFTIVGGRVNARIRRVLFSAMMKQEIGFFEMNRTGDLTSRLSSDATKVGDQASLNVNTFLRSLVQALGTLAFMFFVSWNLSLLAFFTIPWIVLLSKYYGEYMRKLSKKTQDQLAKANSVAEESISLIYTVRCFAGEKDQEKLFSEKLRDFYVLNVREGKAYLIYISIVTLLPNLAVALVLYYGGNLVLEGSLSGGKLVSFLLYLQSLSDALNNLGSIFSSLTQAMGAADKIYEIIKRKPLIDKLSCQVKDDDVHKASPPHKSDDDDDSVLEFESSSDALIELKNVCFSYPTRPEIAVLDHLNLSIFRGQIVALVGHSGSGKSSIFALIEGMYRTGLYGDSESVEGLVTVDGRNVLDIDFDHFHSRCISIVSQEPVLFARSIKENIIFGLDPSTITMKDITESAKLANAHGFIQDLPEGYDTFVGERGVSLSGGQKQRIALARALVRKPKVLLLDEATSALDAESERAVQDAIDSMIGSKDRHSRKMTVILIAHRLSTVRAADVIYVMERGAIAEFGNHDELMDRQGVYANLVRRQIDIS